MPTRFSQFAAIAMPLQQLLKDAVLQTLEELKNTGGDPTCCFAVDPAAAQALLALPNIIIDLEKQRAGTLETATGPSGFMLRN